MPTKKIGSCRHVLALAGGVGGAKLALGLSKHLAPEELTIIVNTGDDEIFHGLHVSPDLDTITYTLAGLSNPNTGWGISGESFRTLSALEKLGAPAWFWLGDVDFATHIRRTELLGNGLSLSEVTQEFCSHLKIGHSIFPMTDFPVRTMVVTEEGQLAFQEYFVHRQCEPVISDIRFHGCESAVMSTGFRLAIEKANAIVFCPSNPLVSLGPILAIPEVRDLIGSFQGPRIAVSPLIGDQAVRGPAAKMMKELGEEVSCIGVAKHLQGLCDILMIDESDVSKGKAVGALGIIPQATNIMMESAQDKERLAGEVLEQANLMPIGDSNVGP